MAFQLKVTTQISMRNKLKITSSSSNTAQELSQSQPCAGASSLQALRARKAGLQAWIFADTQPYLQLLGKVLPALHCSVLPFPPCTYFPSDITGRIRSAHSTGKGEPFPGYLSDDAY